LPKLAAILISASVLVGCFDPDFTAKDQLFEQELQEFVANAAIGEQSGAATLSLLTKLFGTEIRQVCMLGGGDFVPDVAYLWSNTKAPIPAENLRDTGSGYLSLDGIVAHVARSALKLAVPVNSSGIAPSGWTTAAPEGSHSSCARLSLAATVQNHFRN